MACHSIMVQCFSVDRRAISSYLPVGATFLSFSPFAFLLHSLRLCRHASSFHPQFRHLFDHSYLSTRPDLKPFRPPYRTPCMHNRPPPHSRAVAASSCVLTTGEDSTSTAFNTGRGRKGNKDRARLNAATSPTHTTLRACLPPLPPSPSVAFSASEVGTGGRGWLAPCTTTDSLRRPPAAEEAMCLLCETMVLEAKQSRKPQRKLRLDLGWCDSDGGRRMPLFVCIYMRAHRSGKPSQTRSTALTRRRRPGAPPSRLP